jgi:hypothetical protein
LVATACAGLFAGAAVYINIVEHPARLSCGIDLAIREFGPSYHRATIMQASLAIVGCGAGLVAAWERGAVELGIAALLLGSVVPFTLLVILPTNTRLLDPALGRNSAEATLAFAAEPGANGRRGGEPRVRRRSARSRAIVALDSRLAARLLHAGFLVENSRLRGEREAAEQPHPVRVDGPRGERLIGVERVRLERERRMRQRRVAKPA